MHQCTSSALSRIAPILLILLTTTKAWVEASSAPVHGVSVAVRSARSVRYHGMQVPLFENIGSEGSGRYFFPPLALLDCGSTQRAPASGVEASNSTGSLPEQSTMLHLTILLWTEEFLSTARAQLAPPDANASAVLAHVELVPMTELTLTWAGQAKMWLGDDFERRYQLLGDWQEAQKPRERITFTIVCNQSADCRSLLVHFSDTDGSASHLFDLKYRIRCDTQRRLSVPLASRHLLRSPLFGQLRMFAAKTSGIVLTTEVTIEQLTTELRAAALDELERQLGEQRANSVDAAALAALSADAGRLLRQVPVTGAGSTQWAERVFWQQPTQSGRQLSGAGLRPDRLATLLNSLLKPEASGRPRLVRAVPNAAELLLASEGEGELPPVAMTGIRRFLTSRLGSAVEPIDVDEVRELAATLGSPVVWDTASVCFVPSPSVQLFELDTGRLLQLGIFAVRDAVLQYRVSEQRDHVTPLCRAVHASVDYSEESWQAQVDLLGMRMRPLLQRAAKVSAELRRVEAALAAAKAESGADGQVRERSIDSEVAPGGEIRSAIEDVRGRLDTLSRSVSGLVESEAKNLWQLRFADSFCILANTGPPPQGMSCRTISFVIPKLSLRGGILDRKYRIGLGIIGQNLIEAAGPKFFRFHLRGCCK